MSRSAIVVGAGIGGLGCAIRLAKAGWRVTVLEKQARVGGRAGLWEADGFRFDTGPSHLLMRETLQETFTHAGARLEDHLDLMALDPGYRVHFPDGTGLTLTRDLVGMISQCEAIEPGSGPRLLRYMALAGELYRVGMNEFVERPFVRLGALLDPRNAPLLLKGRLLQKLHPLASRFFDDERLRQAFSVQSLYLGLSPYDAPAIYALMPHVELAGGVYFPRGGMHQVPLALARLAESLGVRIRLETPVADLLRDGHRVSGVTLGSGETLAADVVVVNADLPAAYRELLGEPHPKEAGFRYSCGAFLMYLGLRGEAPGVLHHNLVMPADLRASMAAIFRHGRVPDDPLYYLSVPSRSDRTLAPENGETLFVLVPVPNRASGVDWAIEGPRLRDAMLDRLERFAFPRLRERLVVERIVTPLEFEAELGYQAGAAFGLSHDLGQVGYWRPHNRHHRLHNLYFVGASTHPGSGIPMVLISGKLAAERIRAEHPA